METGKEPEVVKKRVWPGSPESRHVGGKKGILKPTEVLKAMRKVSRQKDGEGNLEKQVEVMCWQFKRENPTGFLLQLAKLEQEYRMRGAKAAADRPPVPEVAEDVGLVGDLLRDLLKECRGKK